MLLDERRRRRMEALLQDCKRWWDKRKDFRDRRARSRDYRRGRQWDEPAENEKGEQVTEKEVIEEQGRIPWVINQVASVVRNLKGQYRQNQSERAVFAVDEDDPLAVEMMNVKRRGTRRYNRADLVESDQFEEHILSGASCFKVQIGWQPDLNRNEVEIDPVDQTRLFFNMDVEDRRLKNLRLIGQLHDMSREEMLANFAIDERGDFDRRRAETLKRIYSEAGEARQPDIFADVGFDRTDGLEFYATNDTGLVRVIEVWTKRHVVKNFIHDRREGTWKETELTEAELAVVNQERELNGEPRVELRQRLEPTWWVYYLSPRGDILYESETPYWHEEHPYILSLGNLMDGETWGLVEMIIDPQRWLNRLVISIDHAMGVGAKGVLLVPEDVIPKDMSIDDFAETWSKTGGVLKVKLKPGVEPPKEIVTNSIKPGSFELLQQLKAWIDETSGVTGAQRGEEPSSGTPAALFQQQVIQAGLTNLDYFESFFEGVRELDWKTVQCLQQAIDRRITLSEGATRDPIDYDPQKVREVQFDASIGKVQDTATYRQLYEEDLQRFLEAGFIDFGTYLQISAHPKSDTLLRVLQQRDPDMLSMGTTELQGAMQAVSEGQGPEQLQQELSNVAANRPRRESPSA